MIHTMRPWSPRAQESTSLIESGRYRSSEGALATPSAFQAIALRVGNAQRFNLIEAGDDRGRLIYDSRFVLPEDYVRAARFGEGSIVEVDHAPIVAVAVEADLMGFRHLPGHVPCLAHGRTGRFQTKHKRLRNYRNAIGNATVQHGVIRSRPEEQYPLASLASKVDLSLSRFKARFKAEFGATPHEFILRSKIEAARERLAQGDSVTDIAMRLGFNSSQYFATVFKRFYDHTPTQFRRRGQPVISRRS